MRLLEFMERLNTTYGWRLNAGGKLRCYDGQARVYCPVTYVAMKMTGTYWTIENFADAAEAIGLSKHDTKCLILAADGEGHEADRDFLYKVTHIA